jgi:very-short-patch-repair endonuclease
MPTAGYLASRRLAGAPQTAMTLLTVTALAVGILATDGAASHRSAAHRLSLVDRAPRPAEITVDRRVSYRGPLRVHRPLDFGARDVTMVDGLRCTTPPRTLVDLGAVCGTDVVEAAFHRALRLQLTSFDDVAAHYFALARSGRSGCRSIHEVLVAYDPSMPPAESTLETVLLRILRDAALPAPTRQFTVVVAGERFRIDVAYPELRIAIEDDGFGVHAAREQFERDRQRQNLLVLDGWLILRFTWRQLCRQPELVAAHVRAALATSRRV